MAFIKKMNRPQNYNRATQVHADADHLWLLVDLHEDGTVEEPVVLYFADHSGLEAEYEAGTATTVLESALSSTLGDMTGDSLSSGQRGVMDDYQLAIA